jgi:plasmid stabilization system protein ParE
VPKTFRWLNSALDELDEIHAFITGTGDGLQRADAVVAEVFKQVRLLIQFPEIGHVIPRLRPSHREIIVYSRYRLIYRISDGVDDDVVTVAAIIDTSRRFRKAWQSLPRR